MSVEGGDRIAMQMFEAGRNSMMGATIVPTRAPPPDLSVAEITELAKAGIKIELADVRIVEKRQPYFAENSTLMDPLIHRMRVAFPLLDFGAQHRFQYLSAATTGGNNVRGGTANGVALMAVTAGGNAALLTDDIRAWPSDALMAKLHLLLETEEKSNVNHANGEQQAPRPVQGGPGIGVPGGYAAPPRR